MYLLHNESIGIIDGFVHRVLIHYNDHCRLFCKPQEIAQAPTNTHTTPNIIASGMWKIALANLALVQWQSACSKSLLTSLNFS